MSEAVTKPVWFEIKHDVFAALIATGWKDGTVASGEPAVTVYRGAFSKAPAGRGAEVAATMRACLESYGYRVTAKRHRDRAGARWITLTGR